MTRTGKKLQEWFISDKRYLRKGDTGDLRKKTHLQRTVCKSTGEEHAGNLQEENPGYRKTTRRKAGRKNPGKKKPVEKRKPAEAG